MDLKSLGHKVSFNIKRIIKEKGLTQVEIASKLNTDNSNLSQLFRRIESGQVSLRKLKMLADILEVDIQIFFK